MRTRLIVAVLAANAIAPERLTREGEDGWPASQSDATVTITIAASGVSVASSFAVAAPASHVVASSVPIPASELRAKLNILLQEHTYVAAGATNAALGGRQGEFEAAAGALDANSVDLSKAIGMVYGAGAENAFLALWRKHIGFFVDYTTGVATKDKAKHDKAVNDLVGYTQDFGAFLASANPPCRKRQSWAW
jgi:hypothetical protein